MDIQDPSKGIFLVPAGLKIYNVVAPSSREPLNSSVKQEPPPNSTKGSRIEHHTMCSRLPFA